MDLQTPFREALPDIVTLPQYFKSHGYFSGRVGKVFHQGVPEDIGTSGSDDPQSWTEVVNPKGRDKDDENGKIINLTPGWHWGGALAYLADDGTDDDQTDGKVALAGMKMLEEHKNGPFFIALGFYRPHVPEVAPKKYFDLYPLSKIQLPDETPETLSQLLPASLAVMPANLGLPSDARRQFIQAYDASTSFVDAQVGRVLKRLHELGSDRNTIVVFTSDHGYLLGEHGAWMKNLLWEEADHVPLIIRAPGYQANAGNISHRLVELVDLYPTLTDLVGLPHYERNEGNSLVPLLKQPDDPSWQSAAFSQIRGGRSVRADRWRYTEWEGGKLGRELYDQVADPKEHHNLVDDPKYAAVVAELKAELPGGPIEPRPGRLRYDLAAGCVRLPPGIKPFGKPGSSEGPTFCAPDP